MSVWENSAPQVWHGNCWGCGATNVQVCRSLRTEHPICQACFEQLQGEPHGHPFYISEQVAENVIIREGRLMRFYPPNSFFEREQAEQDCLRDGGHFYVPFPDDEPHLVSEVRCTRCSRIVATQKGPQRLLGVSFEMELEA